MARTAPVPNLIATPGMNPGNIVAGGGGGSGGGSGGDGKDGNGGEGDDGLGNGEDGEGGAKGSGKCGAGTEGSCTNCSSDFAGGDPVSVTDGRTYTVPKTDLFLPGAFNLDFRRNYSSDLRTRDKGLGWGWTHSLAWTLQIRRKKILLNTGDGRDVELPLLKVGEEARNDDWAIKREAPGFVVRPGNDFIHYFARTDDSEVYRLVHVICRNLGQLDLFYDQGRLVIVRDTVGREVVFDYNTEGRIAGVSVPAPNDSTIHFARYDYDSEGNLRAVTDADGNATYYEYDKQHRITRLTYPNSLTFHFRYDRRGRCRETWGAYPGGNDPALADDVPDKLSDGSAAKGIFHCRFEYGDDYTELSNSICLQRFFVGDDGSVGKAIDGTGAVTEREYDFKGRVVALIDPTGGRWETAYDTYGAVIEETDPLGHKTRFERDIAGRVLSTTDPLGCQTKIWRDDYGEPVMLEAASGSVQRFALGAFSRVVERIDARGGSHRYEYDGHANMVAYTTPGQRSYTFQYDYWGRLLQESNALGHTYSYQYSNAGLPVSATDPLGRHVYFSYDSMGKLSRRVNADGSVETWEYGGLDWLYCETHADGSQVQQRYNREGWVTRLENERGEIHAYEYSNSGQLSAETDTFGARVTYSRDALGRLTGYDEGQGMHQLELDAVGQVVARIAPDETRHDFEFSPRGELMRATSPEVEFRWKHDAVGAIREETLVIQGREYRVETELDADGDRIGTKTSLGHELQFSRSLDGHIERVASPDNVVLTIERDATGLPIRKSLSGGATIVEEYDAGLHLKRRAVEVPEARSPTAEPGWVGREHGGIERRFDYSASGELIHSESSSGEVLSLSYDLRRHLKKAEGSLGEFDFNVDGASNYYESPDQGPLRSYGPGNQIEKRGPEVFVHDERGFVTERIIEQGEGADPLVTKYEWDPWGMLSAVDLPSGLRVEYIYDAFARRMGRRLLRGAEVLHIEDYIWDRVSMVHAAEVDVQGKLRELATYLYLENWDETPIGQRLGEFEASQPWQYYLPGLTLAPEQIIDGQGKVLGRLSTGIFGKSELIDGTVGTPFRHPGQQADADTGLHYNRYRYYDPELGRYLSPDPIGVAGGLNLYSYGPNPIGWIDPMGWKHYAWLIDNDGLFTGKRTQMTKEGRYISGSAKRYNCPSTLKSQPKCHTEQKVAHDLLKHYPDGGAKGKSVGILGQMPPCPRCHSAMMRASKESGASIHYKWKDKNGNVQSMSYEGGTGAPSSSGRDANKLRGAYHDETSLTDDWKFKQKGSTKGTSAHDLWGAEPRPGAEAAYETASANASQAHQDDYWSDQEKQGKTKKTRIPRGKKRL